MPDGIALGKKITFHVWATQRGEYVPLLKHFWRAPGTCRANLMCNGACSLRQQGTIFAAATLQPALVEPRSAIAVRVAKRSPAIWQRHSHAKHHCYRARFDAACSHTLWLWLMAALLQTLLLLPSQAPFDLPCSSQRVLVAGTLATGATMVAAAVVAWRQRLAVQGSVLGATAFRLPRWPMAMGQTWQSTDPGPKQAFPRPRGRGGVRAVNPLLGALFGGRTGHRRSTVRDVSASGRAVAAVIIGSAIGGGATHRVVVKMSVVNL